MALRPSRMKKSRPSPTNSGKPEAVRTDHRRKIGRVPRASYAPADEYDKELSGVSGGGQSKLLLHRQLIPIVPSPHNLAVLNLSYRNAGNLDWLTRRSNVE